MNYQLRRMASRIRYCQLNDKQRRLMRSVLGLNGETLLETLYASAKRAWPELSREYYSFQSASYLRETLKKIARSYSLSLPERLMLQKLDLFYQDLEKKFPSSSYAEIEKLAHRFQTNKWRGISERNKSILLTEKQIKIATRFLGLDGTPPFRNTLFALCREFLPETANTAEVRKMYQLYRNMPQFILKKIQRVWSLSEDKYRELLSTNFWYQQLSKHFPERTPHALTTIQNLLQIHSPNAYHRRREEERKTVLAVYHTERWHKLTTRDQEILRLYYSLDSATANTQNRHTIARFLGIPQNQIDSSISHAKDALIAIEPSLPLLVHKETSFAVGVWIQYRRDVLQYPSMDDAAIERHTRAMHHDNTEARDALFHFGLRFVFPIAKKWGSHRRLMWRDTGYTILDLIQEANIGLYSSLPSFSGETVDSFRQFAEFTSEKSIKIALRYQGIPVRISWEFSNSIRRTNKTWKNLFRELRREPTTQEIAMHLHVSTTEIEETLRMIRISVVPTRSLDAPLRNEENDKRTLYDIISDLSIKEPDAVLANHAEEQRHECVANALEQALTSKITSMEQNVILLRFGFDNEGVEMSPTAIAAELKISEEEILHILEIALWKLRTDPDLQTAIRQFTFWGDNKTF